MLDQSFLAARSESGDKWMPVTAWPVRRESDFIRELKCV